MTEIIPAQTAAAIEKVDALTKEILTMPQVDIATHHVLHGGMYARTIKIPQGVVITGALIKVETTLIVSGDVIVWMGDSDFRITGYQVLAARAGRKQAFIAIKDTYLTMSFPTGATTIEAAEKEFTDEANLLMSRRGDTCNIFINTQGGN